MPYAQELVDEFNLNGDKAILARSYDDVLDDGVVFYLSCLRITPPDILVKNHYNLVVHASDLPKGRGFSPTTWQILEGLHEIPVCLLEAEAEVDAGVVYYKDFMSLQGHELSDEWRELLGEKTVELCRRFMNEPCPPEGEKQIGEASFYERRRPVDSRMEIHKSLEEQFDLLRVVDNESYPAYFEMRGHKYVLKIEKAE